MRIDVSEPELCGCFTCIHHLTPCMLDIQKQCGCVTCIQYHTSSTLNTQETEPSNVIGSSVTSVPASAGPVQALGDESSALGSTSTSSPLHSSGTATPLAPPVTTSVNSEPAQSTDSTIVSCGELKSKDAPADASATPTSSTSSPVQISSPTIFRFPHVVSSEPADAPIPTTSGSLPVPAFVSPSFGGPKPSLSSSSQASITGVFGFGAFASSRRPLFGPMQASLSGSGASAASTSSTSSPFAPSPFWTIQAPVQASAPNTFTSFSFLPPQDSGKTASAPPLFSDRGDFVRPNVISPAITTPTPSPFNVPSPWGLMQAPPPTFYFPSPFSDRGDFARPNAAISPAISTPFPPGICVPRVRDNYRSRLFGANPQNTAGRGSSFAAVEAEQGSRYPRYAPTPDLGDQGKMMSSISASNSHGHKSHEELRWEDYKNGDKGGFGWFPPAHIRSTVAPSSFTSPSIPDHPQRTSSVPTQGNMTGFSFGNTIPTGVQRPHESAGVSSRTSGCTACGATSSSSPSGYLGYNVATNFPSVATSLTTTTPAVQAYPTMFGTPNLPAQITTTVSVFQSYPMMFGTPNLSAQGTSTTPAGQAYPMMFGTPDLAAQSTTTRPGLQSYPMTFGTPYLSAQGTSTPAGQAYPMIFGTPNLPAQSTTTRHVLQSYPFGTPYVSAQGTSSTPAVQDYPMIFGTPNLAAQSTTTRPGLQSYPMTFGTPYLSAQGTSTTPAGQAYPMMFGTPNLAAQSTTTRPVFQSYPMMFGTPNLSDQGTSTTPAVQAYPV